MINLMTYDIHGHWEDKTGHHALAHTKLSDDRLGGIFFIDLKLYYKIKRFRLVRMDYRKLALAASGSPKISPRTPCFWT